MLTRSRIIAGASALAGDPPNEPLPGGVPEWLRYETAADLETEMLRDLNISTTNRTLSSYPVRLTAGKREFTVSQSGLENASYVSLNFQDTPDAKPIDVNISNLTLLNDEESRGRRSIAFYSDKPQKAVVSWNPIGTEVLTVWYDRSPATDPSADQGTFTIADSYVPHLKLKLAAQLLEMMGKPIGDMLKARIMRGEAQWEKFSKRSGQQGIITKTPYSPRRHMREDNEGDGTFRVPIE